MNQSVWQPHQGKEFTNGGSRTKGIDNGRINSSSGRKKLWRCSQSEQGMHRLWEWRLCDRAWTSSKNQWSVQRVFHLRRGAGYTCRGTENSTASTPSELTDLVEDKAIDAPQVRHNAVKSCRDSFVWSSRTIIVDIIRKRKMHPVLKMNMRNPTPSQWLMDELTRSVIRCQSVITSLIVHFKHLRKRLRNNKAWRRGSSMRYQRKVVSPLGHCKRWKLV